MDTDHWRPLLIMLTFRKLHHTRHIRGLGDTIQGQSTFGRATMPAAIITSLKRLICILCGLQSVNKINGHGLWMNYGLIIKSALNFIHCKTLDHYGDCKAQAFPLLGFDIFDPSSAWPQWPASCCVLSPRANEVSPLSNPVTSWPHNMFNIIQDLVDCDWHR